MQRPVSETVRELTLVVAARAEGGQFVSWRQLGGALGLSDAQARELALKAS